MDKVDFIIDSITRELKDPILMSYLVTGNSYSYENFPIRHLIDEKLFNKIVRYFIDQDGFLFDLFFEHFNSYSDFKLFESKYMVDRYSKKQFYKKRFEYLSITKEPEDPGYPILPDTCTFDEFILGMIGGNPNLLEFENVIDNNLPFRLPGKKFTMYLNLLKKYNRQKPKFVPKKIILSKKAESRSLSRLTDEEKKVYYIKYHRMFFPKDQQTYDQFQKEMKIPSVTEEEYFEILKTHFN